MAGGRLQRQGQREGLGGEGAGIGSGNRTTPASKPRYVWTLEGEEPDWDDLRARGLLAEPGFKVLPRCWVVERSFSWTGQNRRMSKDYERLPETGETLLYVAMSRLMVRRLARS